VITWLSAVGIIGISGIVAQIILVRELFIGFFGNELILGVIIANWIVAEACGAFIAGTISSRIHKPANLFVLWQIAFASSLPVALYASRCFKSLLGIPASEGISLYFIFIISFFILFLPGFFHGALFTTCCSLLPGKNAIGITYAGETVGTLLGGFLLAFILIPHYNSFQIAAVIILASALSCCIAIRLLRRRMKFFYFSWLGFMLVTLAVFPPNRIQTQSIQKQWANQHVVDYRNSPYGNIVIIQKNSQQTYYYNGIPAIITPNPDTLFIEEYANFPLLFHRNPKTILVINQGAGGIIHEILKHNPDRIDYTELDPLIITLLAKHPTSLTSEELHAPAVHIKTTDGRAYLRQTNSCYDILMIGINTPSDLISNRYFTEEFFSLAKAHLNPGGILALRLPGSLTYISKELGNLNGPVLNALTRQFSTVRIIPGDYTYYYASSDQELSTITPAEIFRRVDSRKIKTTMLIPEYIANRLTDRIDWFYTSMQNRTATINTDMRPISLLQTLILWNKQYSPALSNFLNAVAHLRFFHLIIFIIVLTIISAGIARRIPRYAVAYSIAGTGFSGMLLSLVLMFAFQILHGSLYNYIALLTGIFMAGAAGGSILINARLKKSKKAVPVFLVIETLSVAVSIFVAYATAYILTHNEPHSFLYFSGLIGLAGLLVGLAFPLAASLYKKQTGTIPQASGVLYASDLLGGWLAGILGSVILLPTIGIINTCILAACLKLSTLIIFWSTCKKL